MSGETRGVDTRVGGPIRSLVRCVPPPLPKSRNRKTRDTQSLSARGGGNQHLIRRFQWGRRHARQSVTVTACIRIFPEAPVVTIRRPRESTQPACAPQLQEHAQWAVRCCLLETHKSGSPSVKRTSLHRIGDQRPSADSRAAHRRILVWLAAAAVGPVLLTNLGCTSSDRWAATPWTWQRSAAEPTGDASTSVAATDPGLIASAAEDPQVTEAFARLEQAQAEMRQRQSEAAESIAQANRQGSPSTVPPTGAEASSKVR